jgi:hypothetical protein
MKYFTLDLLERFASEDERIASEATSELERQSEAYAAHLKQIAPKLPVRFAEMQENFYLHDAVALVPFLFWPHPFPPFEDRGFPLLVEFGAPARKARSDENWRNFVLTLRLNVPPQEQLVLSYRQARLDGYGYQLSLPRDGDGRLELLHDEVEVYSVGGEIEVGHSLLFASGLEMRIRFVDFDFATLKPDVARKGRRGAAQDSE